MFLSRSSYKIPNGFLSFHVFQVFPLLDFAIEIINPLMLLHVNEHELLDIIQQIVIKNLIVLSFIIRLWLVMAIS